MPARFWNKARDERLTQLRSDGLLNADIARELGVHESTIATRARLLGLPKRGLPGSSSFWTEERSAQLRDLWARRPMLSLKEMVSLLGGGVSVSYLSAQAGRLGLKGRALPAVEPPAEKRAPSPQLYSRERMSQRGLTDSQLNAIATDAIRRQPSAPRLVYARVVGCTYIDPHGDGSRCGKGEAQTCAKHRERVMPIPRGNTKMSSLLGTLGSVSRVSSRASA